MRHLASFALVLALYATSAWSEPLPVQSGEHGSFTRLVVTTTPGKNWSAKRIDRFIELQIPTQADGFTTDGIFERIDRNRIRTVNATDNTLQIEIGCDCDVATFIDQGRHIVIDVGDKGLTLVGSPIENQEKRKGPAAALEVGPAFDWPFYPSDQNHALPNSSLEVFQKQLAMEIGQLVTLDILKDAPSRLENEAAQSAENQIKSQAGSIGKADTATVNQMIINGLIPTPDITATLEGPEQIECDPINAFALSLNDQSATYSDYVAAQRSFATTQQDDKAQFDLVIKALSLGFGSEARLALSSLEQTRHEIGIAHAISEILESEDTADIELLKKATSCNPAFAFWSFIGDDQELKLSEKLSDEILREFGLLTPPLKRLLGARLANIFRTSGNLEAARLAMEATERSPELPSSQMVEERQAYHLEKTGAAPPTENGHQAPNQAIATKSETYVLGLNQRLAEGGEITHADAHLLDSYLYAETDDQTRIKLLVPAFHVAAKLEENQRSFDILSDIKKIDSELAIKLHNSFLADKLTKSSDFDLIEIGLFSLQHFGDKIDWEMRETLISRMKKAGIPQGTINGIAGLSSTIVADDPNQQISNINAGATDDRSSALATSLTPWQNIDSPDQTSSEPDTGLQKLTQVNSILEEVEKSKNSIAQEILSWTKDRQE